MCLCYQYDYRLTYCHHKSNKYKIKRITAGMETLSIPFLLMNSTIADKKLMAKITTNLSVNEYAQNRNQIVERTNANTKNARNPASVLVSLPTFIGFHGYACPIN